MALPMPTKAVTVAYQGAVQVPLYNAPYVQGTDQTLSFDEGCWWPFSSFGREVNRTGTGIIVPQVLFSRTELFTAFERTRFLINPAGETASIGLRGNDIYAGFYGSYLMTLLNGNGVRLTSPKEDAVNWWAKKDIASRGSPWTHTDAGANVPDGSFWSGGTYLGASILSRPQIVVVNDILTYNSYGVVFLQTFGSRVGLLLISVFPDLIGAVTSYDYFPFVSNFIGSIKATCQKGPINYHLVNPPVVAGLSLIENYITALGGAILPGSYINRLDLTFSDHSLTSQSVFECQAGISGFLLEGGAAMVGRWFFMSPDGSQYWEIIFRPQTPQAQAAIALGSATTAKIDPSGVVIFLADNAFIPSPTPNVFHSFGFNLPFLPDPIEALPPFSMPCYNLCAPVIVPSGPGT